MSALKKLCLDLHDVIDSQHFAEGRLHIQDLACAELMCAISADNWPTLHQSSAPLAQPFVEVMAQKKAHKICNAILEMPFEWLPPQTSDDPSYVALSHAKAHVELVGPTGLIKSENIRLGFFGILPNAEYGVRTHPAEEVFIMLAGEAEWLCGIEGYQNKQVGEYSYHPSGIRHATRTNSLAFMSVYIWSGDISTENYRYFGVSD